MTKINFLISVLLLTTAYSNFDATLDRLQQEILVEEKNAHGVVSYTYRPADILLLRAALLPIDRSTLSAEKQKAYDNINAVFAHTMNAENASVGRAISEMDVDTTVRRVRSRYVRAMMRPQVWAPLGAAVFAFFVSFNDLRAGENRRKTEET